MIQGWRALRAQQWKIRCQETSDTDGEWVGAVAAVGSELLSGERCGKGSCEEIWLINSGGTLGSWFPAGSVVVTD